MKQMLCGTDQIEPQTEVVAALAQEFSNENVILIMSRNLAHMDFEGKKDWCQIFANLLRRQIGTRFPTIEMLNGYEGAQIRDLVQLLVKGLVFKSFKKLIFDVLVFEVMRIVRNIFEAFLLHIC